MDQNQTGPDMFQDEPIEKRPELLESNAHSVVIENVKRDFSDEELQEMKDELADESIIRRDKQSELRAITKSYKAEIDKLNVTINSKIADLKAKSFTSDAEKVFLLDDQGAGVMNAYDGAGKFLYSRPLKRSEKQTKIHSISKAS